MNKYLYAILAQHAEDMRKMEERQEEFLSVDAKGWDFDEDEGGDDRNYQVANGVAIYNIRGKMLHESNFFTRIFGISTYEDISNDLAAMAQDDEVEKTLVSIGTPGGSVAGISETSDAWKKLDAVKPITVHTPSMLASAGIWLASNSSGGIYASETAEVGSIGVIFQHVSQEERLKKEGLKVTEIKSAPLKAIGSPAKDLSEEEEAHLQKKVDETAGLFRRQIYKTRPSVLEEAFSGETFIASEAMRVGLIDGVKNFSDVFTDLVSASADTNINIFHMEGYTMKKKVTAEQFEAAVGSGADPSTMEIVSQDAYDALQDEDVEREKVTQEMFDERVKNDADPESMEVVSQEAFDALDNNTAEDDTEVEDLKVQVEDLTSQLEASTESLTKLEADLVSATEASNTDPLRVIALERLTTMRVALGLQKVDMSDFTSDMLVTEYLAIDKSFKKAYKVGGHVKPKVEKEVKTSSGTSLDEARLRAATV